MRRNNVRRGAMLSMDGFRCRLVAGGLFLGILLVLVIVVEQGHSSLDLGRSTNSLRVRLSMMMQAIRQMTMPAPTMHPMPP